MEYSQKSLIRSLSAVAAAVLAAWAPSALAQDRLPNVIYVLADDLGYGDLSSYGQTKFDTPNIDRLAREGMRFTQHYSGSTVCAPARCSLMTGLHTGHARVRGNKRVPLLPEDKTVAEYFKDAGYATGLVGKWGLGAEDSTGIPTRQGFDFFYGYLDQRNAHFYYPPFLWRNERKEFFPDNDVTSQKGVYSHDAIMNEGLRFIRAHADGPFFLYAAVTIPHAEITVPEDSMKPLEGRFPDEPYVGSHYGSQEKPLTAFAGMVQRLDRDVGRILSLLEELGIDEKTVVMFTSDNGPHQEGGHDPDFWNSNGPLRGIKRDLYEGGIRVPMIARWPGNIAAGAISDHVSAFWDFLPTCADLAGFELDGELDGVSMAPTLLGMNAQQAKHEYLYWEFHEQGKKQAVRWDDWKGVRLNVAKDPDGPIELYNLAEDLSESNNVAAKHPDIVDDIAKMMDKAHTKSDEFPLP